MPRRALVLLVCCLLVGTRVQAQDQSLLSDRLVGAVFTYFVKSGDSLSAVAARLGVSSRVLARQSGLAVNTRLQVGQKLQVDNRHIAPPVIDDGIVINIPQRLLFFYKSGQLLRAYPVALGKPDWPTPTGRFRIAVKEENPVWDVPKSIQEEMECEGQAVKTRVPPGPDNPLGKHWLGLTVGGYGIHGTIAPTSIYQFLTHGCIRLHPDDIAELFGQVERGTPVLLIYRRWLLARFGGRMFLEVHGDVYGKQPQVAGEVRRLADVAGIAAQIDWQRASDIIRKREGIAADIAKEDPNEIIRRDR